MFGVSRTKRVTYSLDNKARARIVGGGGDQPDDYVSSGSEHSAEAADDDVTSDLFFNFAVTEDDDKSPSSSSLANVDSDFEEERSVTTTCDDSNAADLMIKLPIVVDEDDSDEFRNTLRAHVLRALQMLLDRRTLNDVDNKQILRRNVMSYLRNRGYDAAVCKTKWKSCGGVTAGDYEFIDVVVKSSEGDNHPRRYLVDLDFRSEFEIARPTSSYERTLECLPRVFVGKGEEMKSILKVMSDAARRSLKSRGLITPPWRKHRYMQNKWLGAYRRTMNVYPTTTTSSRVENNNNRNNVANGVLCRAVGFDGGLVLPAAARTR